jgi:hypothetical protein
MEPVPQRKDMWPIKDERLVSTKASKTSQDRVMFVHRPKSLSLDSVLDSGADWRPEEPAWGCLTTVAADKNHLCRSPTMGRLQRPIAWHSATVAVKNHPCKFSFRLRMGTG